MKNAKQTAFPMMIAETSGQISQMVMPHDAIISRECN